MVENFGKFRVFEFRGLLRGLVDQVPREVRQILAVVGEARGSPETAMVEVVRRIAGPDRPASVCVDLKANIDAREVIGALVNEFGAVEVAAEIAPFLR